MRGFKSIFVSSKHKIKCFLIHEKYFQATNAVDTLPLKESIQNTLRLENKKCHISLHTMHDDYEQKSDNFPTCFGTRPAQIRSDVDRIR